MVSYGNRHLDDLSKVDWVERTLKASKFLGSAIREFAFGVRSHTIPWAALYIGSTSIAVAIVANLDSRVFNLLHISVINPHGTGLFWIYSCTAVFSPFWLWAILKARLARQLRERLVTALTTAGLRNQLGKVPTLVFDKPIDPHIRRLRLTKAGFTKKDFEGSKTQLQSSLQIYIDAIEDRLEHGTVDFVYGHSAMPNDVSLGNIDQIPPRHFIVGRTRSKEIVVSLKECPHLLVAGITNGGKSTFLRQIITTLYLKTPGARFTLIDLKGGLEFQLFEKFRNIYVTETMEQAIRSLKDTAVTLNTRMTLLRLNGVKDIEAYEKIPISERKRLDGNFQQDDLKPLFLVIDEAAEMFLAGQHASTQNIQAARKCLSQVARQGRSSGVHLFIATQRPDVKALDSQVKANLGGVLSFHMANPASSMTVLGSWRAAELPAIPGRAIWKMGSNLVELQTPNLDPSQVDFLLKDFIKDESERKPVERDPSEDIQVLLPMTSEFPDASKFSE
jgi:hypothetical protein